MHKTRKPNITLLFVNNKHVFLVLTYDRPNIAGKTREHVIIYPPFF
jgi:hypothetical protein